MAGLEAAKTLMSARVVVAEAVGASATALGPSHGVPSALHGAPSALRGASSALHGAGRAASQAPARRLWGLTVEEIHGRYWESQGLRVIRLGERQEPRESQWYLLTERDLLVTGDLGRVLEAMYWSGKMLMAVRLRREGREELSPPIRVLRDAGGGLRGFATMGGVGSIAGGAGGGGVGAARMYVTSSAGLAAEWARAESMEEGKRRLRMATGSDRRGYARAGGEHFDGSDAGQQARFMKRLAMVWKSPAPAIAGVRRAGPELWADEDSEATTVVPMVGPVWLGAGRRLTGEAAVLGPAILWDHPEWGGESSGRGVESETRGDAAGRGGDDADDEAWVRTENESWEQIDREGRRAARRVMVHMGRVSSLTLAVKRGMDVVGALVGLTLSAPLYPLIMGAIWLEDRGPFFFGHRRETLGGREFKCWKFRSMRKDAEAVKAKLKNEVDGPQFFMREDPRITRVGAILRKTNLDEIPQFWNVLRGEMSLVGPRPSPRSENRNCPAWRDARLSVRPGITGLWQVERTRAPGVDFQEWVKYDVEYVQRMSLLTDLWIMLRTVKKVLGGGGGGR